MATKKAVKPPKFSRTKVTISFEMDPVLNVIFDETMAVQIDNADDSAAVVGSDTYEIGKGEARCFLDFDSIIDDATEFKLQVKQANNEITIFKASSNIPEQKIAALLEKANNNPDFARALVELAKKNRVKLDVEEGNEEGEEEVAVPAEFDFDE